MMDESQSFERFLGRHAGLAEPLGQILSKGGMMLEQAIDQVVLLLERHELERWATVDGDDHWLVVAKLGVLGQAPLASLSGITFMVFRKLLSLHDQGLASLLTDEDDRHNPCRFADIEEHAVFAKKSQLAAATGFGWRVFI